MTSKTFNDRTQSEAEAKFEQWQKAGPRVLEKSLYFHKYYFHKEGTPAGKNAPLSDMAVERVTLTVHYEDLH